jgi:hypothetical protein
VLRNSFVLFFSLFLTFQNAKASDCVNFFSRARGSINSNFTIAPLVDHRKPLNSVPPLKQAYQPVYVGLDSIKPWIKMYSEGLKDDLLANMSATHIPEAKP